MAKLRSHALLSIMDVFRDCSRVTGNRKQYQISNAAPGQEIGPEPRINWHSVGHRCG
jgi:hypothetical protein